MSTITYKCPNCDADLTYRPATGDFGCEYCGSSYTGEQLNELIKNQKIIDEQKESEGTAFDEHAVVYTCPNCGAEVITDDTTAATFCFYCHNPVILKGRLSGGMAPDKVIPFSIPKEKVKEQLISWCKSKKYIDDGFFSEMQLEKLTGVYFPFWLADNEAFIQEQIDITALNEYLKKKTEGDPEFKYTYLHAIVAALVRTITLRPKMNRFISGNRIYQRRWITAAFMVKRQFADESSESIFYKAFGDDDNIDTIHQSIKERVTSFRKGSAEDNSTDKMGLLLRLPPFMMRLVMKILFSLDRKGKVPDFLIKEDPNQASVFVTNLGSIGLHAGYHHLTNWGTNSIFVVIGEKHMAPFYQEDGSVEMREVIDLGVTLDERIADGYYYSKTIKLLKHLLTHPELLDQKSNEEVEL